VWAELVVESFVERPVVVVAAVVVVEEVKEMGC
jgi:hypothetical protein